MNGRDSLLGRSTEGRNLKHFNVSVSIFHQHPHVHTHSLSCSSSRSLLRLRSSFDLRAKLTPLPHRGCRFRHPPSTASRTWMQLQYRCWQTSGNVFGSAPEVTVWTNRDRTSYISPTSRTVWKHPPPTHPGPLTPSLIISFLPHPLLQPHPPHSSSSLWCVASQTRSF